MIHVAIVAAGIAAILLFLVLPRIRFHQLSGSTGTTSQNGSTCEGVISGRHVRTVALADSARRAPRWKPADTAPPIPVERAVSIAEQTFPKLGVNRAEWRLESVTLDDTWHDQSYYYAVRFCRPDDRVAYPWETFVVAVFLDGTTAIPQ